MNSSGAEMRHALSQILSFRDLDAWKAAIELVLAAYDVAHQLPTTERFELAAQMRRAAVSIPSNIAEGQATGPGGRYRHHVRIALGSLAELETQLELALRLKWISAEAHNNLAGHVARTGKLLHGLSRSLWRRRAASYLTFASFGLAGAAALLFS
jgi:four helix bundle protein